jgi:hypothetical protein
MANGKAYEIERGVPPPTLGRNGVNLSEIIRQMEPGDSVFFPKHKADYIYRYAYTVTRAKRNGRRFVARAVDGGGARLWRVQ